MTLYFVMFKYDASGVIVTDDMNTAVKTNNVEMFVVHANNLVDALVKGTEKYDAHKKGVEYLKNNNILNNLTYYQEHIRI